MNYKMKKVIDFFKYDIPYGIKNLVKWFPVIWKDRGWDHQYIYDMLYFKLKDQEKCIRNGIHLNADKTADKIKVCYLLLDRLRKDDYYDNAFMFHNKKWGEPTHSWEDIGNDYVQLIQNVPNVKTEEEEKKYYKQSRRLHEHIRDMEEQDLNMLFKLMNKHIRSWWD